MLTTRYLNDMNHEISDGATVIGWITRHGVDWTFSASRAGTVAGYSDGGAAETWQNALPTIGRAS